jgi:hypothetical protein
MIAFAVLSFFSLQLKAQNLPPNNPCPPFSESTEFCFENSTEYYASGCERTICITYTPRPNPPLPLGNCPAPAPNSLCITLQAGATGCINVPHPAGNISDWFDMTFTVHTTSSSSQSTFSDSELDDSIENQSSTTLFENGGCDPSHTLKLITFDGRFFTIYEVYTLGTGG